MVYVTIGSSDSADECSIIIIFSNQFGLFSYLML